MNRTLRHFAVLVFAACFIALQFHQFNGTEAIQKGNLPFQIKESNILVLNSKIDEPILYPGNSVEYHTQLNIQKSWLKQQRQYLGRIERLIKHPFRVFILQTLSVISMSRHFEDELLTKYEQQKIHELTLELSPVFIFSLFTIHSDEPTASLS